MIIEKIRDSIGKFHETGGEPKEVRLSVKSMVEAISDFEVQMGFKPSDGSELFYMGITLIEDGNLADGTYIVM